MSTKQDQPNHQHSSTRVNFHSIHKPIMHNTRQQAQIEHDKKELQRLRDRVQAQDKHIKQLETTIKQLEIQVIRLDLAVKQTSSLDYPSSIEHRSSLFGASFSATRLCSLHHWPLIWSISSASSRVSSKLRISQPPRRGIFLPICRTRFNTTDIVSS